MNEYPFWLYLAVTAGVTYLVRMLPLVLIKGTIKNRFLLSFLHYIPYAVLTVMTVPALVAAWKGKGLLTVALCACTGALLIELVLTYLIP